ncbi:MAG: hypothetical protein ACFB0C_10035 [Leptolyngbyaceae cyanobacterium]
MRQLLDKLDPFFAAAAIVIAGLTVYSQVPYQIIPFDLPSAAIINQAPGK